MNRLFIMKSNFTENHFTSCAGGGAALSFAVGKLREAFL